MTTSAPAWLVGALAEAGSELLVLTLQVLPFFVIGAATGAAVQAWLPARWSVRFFGGAGRRSVYAAVAAGALLPGCSCATMPMAAGMQASTPARLGTVTAFIFVSPLLSPVTVALTWGMLGWRMTAARVIASLVGSNDLREGQRRLRDHFTGLGRQDVRADDLLGTGIRHQLDEPPRVPRRERPRYVL